MPCILRFAAIIAIVSFVCAPSAHAASKPSPNISGGWEGSVKGTDYYFQSTGGVVTSVAAKTSGTVVAFITQTGNDLSFTVTITGIPSKSNNNMPETFTVPFTGKVGDFAFWATGVKPAGTNPAANVFASGHFDSKPSKITGNMIFYRKDFVSNVSYSLKNIASMKDSRDAAQAFAPSPDDAARATTAPFNIAGTETGKSYDFTTSNKAMPVKATFTGTVDPAAGTVTATVVTGSVMETFNATETFGGIGYVDVGASGSDSRLLFGVESKTGSAGIGWSYNDTGMIEFKFKVKNQ